MTPLDAYRSALRYLRSLPRTSPAYPQAFRAAQTARAEWLSTFEAY